MTEDNKVTDKKTLTQNDKGVTMKENPDTSAAQVSIAPTLKSPLSLSHLCVRVQLESYKRKTLYHTKIRRISMDFSITPLGLSVCEISFKRFSISNSLQTLMHI